MPPAKSHGAGSRLRFITLFFFPIFLRWTVEKSCPQHAKKCTGVAKQFTLKAIPCGKSCC